MFSLISRVSAGSVRDRGRLIGAIAILGLCAIAADPVVSENWVTISTAGITAIAVDADSVTTLEGSPETTGAWFRFTYSVSLDCSPPRGCLAASQRIYYRVTCIGGIIGGAVTPNQRILLDLAGNVLAQSEVTLNAAPHIPTLGSIESDAVRSYCSDYRFANKMRSSPPPAWTPSTPIQPVPLPPE